MNILNRLFVVLNTFVFQLTGGRVGGQMGKQSVLLLHSVGRKSGKDYVTPLSFFRDAENYLVVASNWGRETDPDWFRNLMHAPRTRIQVKGKLLDVQVRQATAEEYPRLWKWVTSQNPQYVQYQQTTSRRIPIVVLTPV